MDEVIPAHITFPTTDLPVFGAEVKHAVAAYFGDRGLSSKATPAMVVKTVIFLGTTFGAYLLILLTGWPPLAKLGLVVVMGFAMAGIGFSVAHDALHGAYSSRKWLNDLLGRTIDLLGANGYLWRMTHNIIHHTYTNIEGVDEDLSVSPLLRVSPSRPLLPIHRWQHLYGFPAYGGSTLFWVFAKDFKYFFKRDLGPYTAIRHPPKEMINLVASKLIFYVWSLGVPMVVLDLPWHEVLFGYLVLHLVAGFALGVVFQLAHIVEGPDYPEPDRSGRMEDAWLIHQMRTTADFAPSNRLLSWYVGGLNYQVEHHLFPRICSVHYPKIAPIVREVAGRHGVPYHCHPTLMAAVRSHHRMLRRLGPEAWEARRRMAVQPA